MKLKTQKDTLRTLKEIEWDESGKGDYQVCSDSLRTEAIRWIKESQEEQVEADASSNLQGRIRYHREFAVQRFIKHFFNLTDKDLEGKE